MAGDVDDVQRWRSIGRGRRSKGELEMTLSHQAQRIGACVLVLCLGAIHGCTGDPPGTGSSSLSQTAVQYHPDNDSLINPPELFDKYDPARADDDAVLTRHLIGEPATLNPAIPGGVGSELNLR